MKRQVRVLGIDDSPFKFGDGKSVVVGALVRSPGYLEAVMRTEVTVDGTDATELVVDMVLGSRYREQVKVVMIDGVALAGFNVVDIDALHEVLEVPVLTVTRDPPDMDGIRAALEKHFEDWRDRFAVVTKHPLRRIKTTSKPLYASGVGLTWKEFEEVVAMSTVRGVVPEPVRVAHLVSSAMARGESYGRA